MHDQDGRRDVYCRNRREYDGPNRWCGDYNSRETTDFPRWIKRLIAKNQQNRDKNPEVMLHICLRKIDTKAPVGIHIRG